MSTPITCQYCGGEAFSGGEFEPSEEGGVDIIMICARCGGPNKVFNEKDPEMAKELISFFTDKPSNKENKE